MLRPALLLAALACCSSCAATPEPSGSGSLNGRVLLAGPPPVLETWPVSAEMLPFHTGPEFTDESWLLGGESELANCVVTLEPLDLETPEATPLEVALYEKVGPRYEPRVLIVTPRTEVTLRNRDSPCNGFMCRGRYNQFNFTMTAGNERVQVLSGRGPQVIQCDLRPYMRGVIYVSPSPYYALTGADGRYRIDALPPGRYALGLWHERLGRVASESVEVSIAAGGSLELSHAVPSQAPTRGRP